MQLVKPKCLIYFAQDCSFEQFLFPVVSDLSIRHVNDRSEYVGFDRCVQLEILRYLHKRFNNYPENEK